MKDFIQAKLRLMLESFTETLVEAITYSSEADMERFKYAQVDYHKRFSRDPYFMSDNEGDAILRVTINQHGVVLPVRTAKASADIAKSNIGQVGSTKDYLIYHVMVGRGIEHPGTYKDRDHDAVTRKGGGIEYDIRSAVSPEGELVKYKVAKPGSPASDAVIKVFMNHGKDIENFIKKNMKGYDTYTDADDSGKEIAAAKNSPELVDMVQGKTDKLNRKAAVSKNLPTEISDLVKRKGELVDELSGLKRQKGSESRAKQRDIRVKIKELDSEIRRLSDERSGKAEYLRNKNK